MVSAARPLGRQKLTVRGLGPAGIITAHRAAARGWEVTGVDPHGPRVRGTLACWGRQVPRWLPADAVAARFRPWVVFDGVRRQLDDAYVVLSTEALTGLGGFRVLREAAERAEAARENDGAGLVIDCTPAPRLLPARQLAEGVVIPEVDLPARHRVPVIMDFTAVLPDLPWATFSYRVPLGDGRWLIEETVLATEDTGRAAGHRRLREVLDARLDRLGVTSGRAGDSDPHSHWRREVVDFALAPRDLPVWATGHRPRIGANSGWMHPATGYSVGAVLTGVEDALDRITAGRAARSLPVRGNDLLRRRGLRAMLDLDPTQLTAMMEEFFRLSPARQRAYFTGDAPASTALTMAQLWGRLMMWDRGVAMRLAAGTARRWE